MTTLIPSIGACTFDSGGERRFAERLEQKLEGDDQGDTGAGGERRGDIARSIAP